MYFTGGIEHSIVFIKANEKKFTIYMLFLHCGTQHSMEKVQKCSVLYVIPVLGILLMIYIYLLNV